MRGPAAGQNILFDAARDEIRPLTDSELFRQIPMNWRLCRVYTETREYQAALAAALDTLIGPNTAADRKNV